MISAEHLMNPIIKRKISLLAEYLSWKALI